MKYRRSVTAAVTVGFMLVCGVAFETGGAGAVRDGGYFSDAVAHAGDEWRSELEELCSRTSNAMDFSLTELKTLVDKCDRLKVRIEALDETSRKVFGKRLKQCRDFYAFMIESKEAGGAKPQ
jgi:hypothetical protein